MSTTREVRLEKMLRDIDERLGAYPVEVTVDRLHSYGGTGPTVEEFAAEHSHSISLAKEISIESA